MQSRRAVDALSLGQPEEIRGVGLQEQITAGAARPQPDDAVQPLPVLQRHQRFVQGEVEGRAPHQAITAQQQADGAGRGLLGAAERIVGEGLRQRQRINPQPGDTQPQTGMIERGELAGVEAQRLTRSEQEAVADQRTWGCRADFDREFAANGLLADGQFDDDFGRADDIGRTEPERHGLLPLGIEVEAQLV